jgi:hypothetical protein
MKHYVEGVSRFDFLALNAARKALGIHKRSINTIPKPIDPRMA